MQRYYPDRETSGPEFDNKLIQLVRSNPAIYDVSHPHYRRNPVRVAIWDRIAAELGAPSRFLQTKWKNIRYNYLQEVKCMELGTTNPNIRKRRFTEDLTFLQYTAQTYNVKKAQNYKNSMNIYSDNDSNSLVYPDNDYCKPMLSGEVIEIENSDDGSRQDFDNNESGLIYDNDNYDYDDDNETHPSLTVETELKEDPDIDNDVIRNEFESCMNKKQSKQNQSDTENNSTADNSLSTPPPPPTTQSNDSHTPPLLTPMVMLGNGKLEHKRTNGEITIEAIPKVNKQQHQQQSYVQTPKRQAPQEILRNMSKRKSEATTLPCLTPINDPIELYCLSLVDAFRNMPRSERERVKYEFANILKDAKYKDQC